MQQSSLGSCAADVIDLSTSPACLPVAEDEHVEHAICAKDEDKSQGRALSPPLVLNATAATFLAMLAGPADTLPDTLHVLIGVPSSDALVNAAAGAREAMAAWPDGGKGLSVRTLAASVGRCILAGNMLSQIDNI